MHNLSENHLDYHISNPTILCQHAKLMHHILLNDINLYAFFF